MTWNTNFDKIHAFKIFSDSNAFNSSDDSITVSSPDDESVLINDFTGSKLLNTSIEPDQFGGDDIALSLDDKIINICIDESGSMLWNDPNDLRYDVVDRLTNRIESTYPGNVYYNLFTFNGQRAKITTMAANSIEDPFNDLIDLENCHVELDKYKDEINRFAGIRLVRNKNRYPQSPLDGEIVFEGICTKISESEIDLSTEYFYKIYTFDKNLKFSPGKSFKLSSNNSSIPTGLDSIGLEFLSGIGAVVDSNTLASWQFTKANEDYVYDFTGRNNLPVSNNMTWLSKSEVVFGASALRFPQEGISFTDINDDLLIPATDGKITVMAWIFPHSSGGFQSIISKRNLALNTINYMIFFDNSGAIYVSTSNETAIGSAGAIAFDTWNFIAITIDFSLSSDHVKFYINGAFLESRTLATPSTSAVSGTEVSIGETNGTLFFFGAMSYLSVHSDIKESDYILNRFLDSEYSDQDNGDRLLLGKGFVGDNIFLSNELRVVYDRKEDPSLPEEFEIVYQDASMSNGSFFFTHKTNFCFDETYRYRVFTYNGTNFSHIDDSQLFEISPPTLSQEAQERKSLESMEIASPSSIGVINGNRKAYLKWDKNNLDNNIHQIRIYYSKQEFPIVDSNSAIPIGESYTGELIFAGDPAVGAFLHENIENDIFHYYTFVFSDGISYSSNGINAVSFPELSSDETMIPLKDVHSISYEQIPNNSSVNIFWELPYNQKTLSGYFDEDFVFFAKVTDEFNNILDVDDFTVSATISSSFTKIENNGEDVFKGIFSFENIDESSLYQFVPSKFKDGIFKGTLTFPSPERLLNYKSCELEIVLNVSIPDLSSEKDLNNNYVNNIFTYKSEPFKLIAKNPIDIGVFNIESKKVELNKNNPISVISEKTLQEKVEFNGLYIGSTQNIILRAILDNVNSLVTSPSGLRISVFETKTDIFSESNLSPENIEFSESIISEPPSIVNGQIDLTDENGNPTGQKIQATYVDISISAPSYPVNLLVYIEVSLDSFRHIVKYPLVFANPLKIDLQTGIPSADGLALEEQFATVYIVDPDDPTNLSARTLVPDGTPVLWNLTKGSNATLDRPFISMSSSFPVFEVPPDTVVSFTTNGVAREIFFGPLTEVEIKGYDSNLSPIFEQYDISANVFYDGKSAQAKQTVELVPLIFEPSTLSGSYFLMEFADKQQKFYTDGISYARMTISHNPSSSITRYSSCFVECLNNLGKPIYTLLPGTGVQIATDDPDIEIIYGNVLETVDPYTGRGRLDTSNAKISFGSAVVPLEEGNETYVYFRKNENIKNQAISKVNKFSNPCDCLGIDRESVYNKEIKVFGSLTSIFNGNIETLTGGGSLSLGVPPTILIPEDPLKISLVAIKVENEIIEGLKIDGESINELIFDISFASFPVPDGVEITAQIVNLTEDIVAVNLDSTTTSQYVDVDISESEKSYASISLREIPRGKPFESYLIVTATYDELGEIARTITSCYSISYNSDEDTGAIVSSLFSKKLYKINTSPVDSEWSSLSEMPIARSSHGLLSDGSGNLYAIGGINSSGVIKDCHVYSTGSNAWTQINSMPTAKFGFQSIYVSGKIYVFGGYVYNEEFNRVEVSQESSVYDTATGLWQLLTEMPSIDLGYVDEVSYGIANGVIQHVSGVIYILSGVRKISEDGSFVFYNDRILNYTIGTDSWGWTDKIDEDEVFSYRRISPASFVDGSDILVFSGSNQDDNGKVSLLSTAYKFNTSTSILSDANSDFLSILTPSYKSGNTFTSGSRCFLAGGIDHKSKGKRFCKSLDLSVSPYEDASDGIPDLPESIFDGSLQFYSNALYLSGGNRSGNDKDMVIIDAKVDNPTMPLNSRDHLSVYVELKNDDGEIISDTVTLVARGFVQDKEAEELRRFIIPDEYAKYEVIFETERKSVTNGKTSFVLKPRSDDVLKELFDTIDLMEGSFADRYKIIIEILVDSDVRFGKTILNVNSDEPEIDQIREDCVSIFNNLKIAQLNVSNAVSEGSFSLVPYLKKQGESAVVNAVTDDIWVNKVTKLNSDFIDSVQVSEHIASLSTEIPFGNSPLYNALYEMSMDLSNVENDNIEKIIYVFTDKEESFSSISIDDAISELNSIDGPKEVPCIIGNFSDVKYPSIHSLEKQTESDHLNRISYETNGQAITVRNENLDDAIGILSGKAKGSVGYGNAKYVHDFEKEVIIKSIRVNYDLYDNTGGYWHVSKSNNGQSFVDKSKRFKPNTLIELNEFSTRFLEFDLHMFSSLSIANGEEYESIPTASGPVITGIEISYTNEKEDFIYLNLNSLELDPSQVVVAIDSNKSLNDNIKVEIGASTADSFEWEDFNTDSEPAVDDGGRIFLLRRQGEVEDITLEPLDSVDKYMFKTRYGSWHNGASVSVYNASNYLIDSSKYAINAEKGLIIFSEKQLGNLYVNIDNSSNLKIAARIVNKNSGKTYKIYGLGYLYTIRDSYSLIRNQDLIFILEIDERKILFSANDGQKAIANINGESIKFTKTSSGFVWDDFGDNETLFDSVGQSQSFTIYSEDIDETVSYIITLNQIEPLKFTIKTLGFVE